MVESMVSNDVVMGVGSRLVLRRWTLLLRRYVLGWLWGLILVLRLLVLLLVMGRGRLFCFRWRLGVRNLCRML